MKNRCRFKIQSTAQLSDSLTAIELEEASYLLVSHEQRKTTEGRNSVTSAGELPKNSPISTYVSSLTKPSM